MVVPYMTRGQFVKITQLSNPFPDALSSGFSFSELTRLYFRLSGKSWRLCAALGGLGEENCTKNRQWTEILNARPESERGHQCRLKKHCEQMAHFFTNPCRTSEPPHRRRRRGLRFFRRAENFQVVRVVHDAQDVAERIDYGSGDEALTAIPGRF
jgi:hypothetical protein